MRATETHDHARLPVRAGVRTAEALPDHSILEVSQRWTGRKYRLRLSSVSPAVLEVLERGLGLRVTRLSMSDCHRHDHSPRRPRSTLPHDRLGLSTPHAQPDVPPLGPDNPRVSL